MSRLRPGRGRDAVMGAARRLTARGAFAVFHVGRSGSRVLSNALDQHPAIHCEGELLKGAYRMTPAVRAAGKPLREPCDPVRAVRARLPRAGLRAFYGFEVKFYHLRGNGMELDAFVDGVARAGVTHFVALERRNTLRKVVSRLVGRERGRMHYRSGEIPPPTRIVLDVDAVDMDSDVKPLRVFLEGFERDFQRLRELLGSRRSLWLRYEDDVEADPRRASDRVCDFLGLPRHRPRVHYTRTTPEPLRQVLANYDDVARHLAGTPFAWMLTA